MEILFFVVIPIFLAIWSKYSEDKKLAKAQAELKARREEELDWIYIKEVRFKKFGNDIPTDYKDIAKQKRFLLSRGFNSENIEFAMKK